ncbi:MAG: hypothetical protein GY845_36880 [Planctomycetes bacterium]|nr:hypothetical protein [Planctomycetota bacterium]
MSWRQWEEQLRASHRRPPSRSTLKTSEVHIHLNATTFPNGAISELKSILERHPGRCDAFLEIDIPETSITTIALPNRFRVDSSDALLMEIDGLAGVMGVGFR